MIYIFLSLIFYTGVIIVGTFASRMANTNMVSAIINIVSAIIPTIVILPLLNKANVQNQRAGLVAAVVAGIFVALFSMALNKSYSQEKIGIVAPIVFGGSIIFSTIISYFIFKEKITLVEGLGLLVLGLGFLIIIYARFSGR